MSNDKYFNFFRICCINFCVNFIFKERFVEEVHGSGVLVYLSATWLSELYQQVLACNLLEKCGYNPSSTENNALVNVLTGMRY